MRVEANQLSAAEWTARLSETQELSQAERAALTDFLRESPLHVRELIEQTFIREDLKALRIPPQQLERWVTEARASIVGAIPFPGRRSGESDGGQAEAALADGQQSARRWSRSGRGLLLAASVAVALVVGAIVAYSRAGLYTTGFGEQRILTLSDGSVVSMNTESQMRVQFSEHKRSITLLRGEAFFRVAHDVDRPFYVSADNLIVRAVGTQFNVKIAPDDTVVSMVDGVVKVSLEDGSPARSGNAGRAALAPQSQITLYKGEEARVNHEAGAGTTQPPIDKVDTPAALTAASWTQGRLEFDGTPLVDVLAEFQRYRQFTVEMDDEATRQLKLTGSFDSDDPESVLAYIATVPGMAVEKRGPHSYFVHRR